jgi:dimethylargininase
LSLGHGERTFIDAQPIDMELAVDQHQAYQAALAVLGVTIETLPALPAFPDSVFVEDTALVLPEVAVLGSMGVSSRVAEVDCMRRVLARFREIVEISPPATLEGGDVLVVGKRILVGLSARTNTAGIELLNSLLVRLGYRVIGVPVRGCLHLKTACTALPDGRLLINPAWVESAPLAEFETIDISSDEIWAACQLPVGQQVLMDSAHRQTASRLNELGYSVLPLELSEFAKAEAGPTCLSLLFSVD